ncbi:Amidase [Novymonas esmeraldas]|uniref:Amidase n=1 Tax=Novymonas esmeraldas TaxID=1808958 RepID=A0AAW0ELH6_9TRYP
MGVLKLSLFLAAAAGAVVAYRSAYLLGLIVYGVGVCAVCNWWVGAFMRAGPRTSRQVPPQPIAACQQLSAQELSKAYREGRLSCVEVVHTFIEHIKRVNPYINAIVFDCFDEAMVAAAEADRVWSAWRVHKDPARMPSWLLGVPCTIKECMECRGCPNTSGNPNRRHIISDVDSPVVKNFRDAGAIILGVTNTSELCMWYESSNYMYGITSNPYDTRCLVGGSSGGEGAAAGAAFSTFSLGSDIGGSIRMPAFFNGVYGHKASPHYISNNGQHPGAKTSANHYMATGPICRFPEDLIPLSKIAARGGFRLDPVVYPPCSPLEKVLDLDHHPLRVYALEDFGLPFIDVSPSEIEAVHAAAEVLRERYRAEVTYINLRTPSRCTGGVVPPQFQPFARILSMWSSVLTKDPTESKFSIFMAQGHAGGVNWCAEVVRWLFGRSHHTLPAISLCLLETLELVMPRWMTISRDEGLLPFKEGLEALLAVDGVIVAPTFPTAAPRHHFPLWNPFQFQYTAAFNVLQLPATACPVWAGPIMSNRLKSVSPHEARAAHLPSDFHLPKGVQVVSATHQDELCISVAIALKEALGGYRYPAWSKLEGVDY